MEMELRTAKHQLTGLKNRNDTVFRAALRNIRRETSKQSDRQESNV